MKIKVTQVVGQGWKADDNADTLYTVHIEGQGEPQKTYDESLARVGEHEAESFVAKSGKTYWRTKRPQMAPRAPYKQSVKEFKADKDKMALGQWQTAMNAGRQIVADFYNLKSINPDFALSIDDYKRTVVNAAITCASTISIKPGRIIKPHDEHEHDNEPAEDDNQTVERAADFAKINPAPEPDDLPPVELYEEQARQTEVPF